MSLFLERKGVTYTAEQLTKALRAVEAGASINAARDYYKIPRSTLAKKFKVTQKILQATTKSSTATESIHIKPPAPDVLTDNNFPKPRKIKRRKYTYENEDLERALQAVADGGSLHGASEYFGVPLSILQANVSGKIKRASAQFDYSKYGPPAPKVLIVDEKAAALSKPLTPSPSALEDLLDDADWVESSELMEAIDLPLSPQQKEPEKLCCACLTEDSNVLQNLNQHVIDCFKTLIPGIQLEGLKTSCKHICLNCIAKLNIAQEFIQTCTESFRVLKQMNDTNVAEDELKTEEIMIKVEPEFDEYEGALVSFEEKPRKVESVPNKIDEEEFSDEDKEATVDDLELDGGFCSLCGKFFEENEENHQLTQHCSQPKENLFVCGACNHTTTSRSEFLSHLNFTHIRFREPVQCPNPNCEYVFKFKSALSIHLKYHTFQLVCDFCQKGFLCKKFLKAHMKAEHRLYRECPICKETVKNGEVFEQHMTDHKNVRPVCEECGKTFGNEYNLRSHIKRVHVAGSYPCNQCNKVFPSLAKYEYHMEINHPKSSLLCPQCGKSVSTTAALVKHMRIHQDAPKRKNPCNICGKSYGWLQGHIQQVHGDAKWKCQLCDAAFRSMLQLQKHMYSHLKKRPYNCHLCETGYYMVEYLKGHYERSHELTLTKEEINKCCIRVKIDKSLLKQKWQKR